MALDPVLVGVARAARVRVEVECPAEVTAPAAVARAVAGAVSEALENVARHAGVDTACVRATRHEVLDVRVTDDGAGFDPGRVGAHREGETEPVRDRMSAVDGVATVESAPGCGTVVRLRWPA